MQNKKLTRQKETKKKTSEHSVGRCFSLSHCFVLTSSLIRTSKRLHNDTPVISDIIGSCPTVVDRTETIASVVSPSFLPLFFTSSVHFLVSWPARGDCGWSGRPRWPTQTWQGWLWTACGPSCTCRPCRSFSGWYCAALSPWTWRFPRCQASKSKCRGTGTHRHGRGWSGDWTHTFPAPVMTENIISECGKMCEKGSRTGYKWKKTNLFFSI